jgi:hypothetical protein
VTSKPSLISVNIPKTSSLGAHSGQQTESPHHSDNHRGVSAQNFECLDESPDTTPLDQLYKSPANNIIIIEYPPKYQQQHTDREAFNTASQLPAPLKVHSPKLGRVQDSRLKMTPSLRDKKQSENKDLVVLGG